MAVVPEYAVFIGTFSRKGSNMNTKIALAVAATLSMAGTAQAAWTDLSFEDASLSGWSASGNGATASRVATVFGSTYGSWMEHLVASTSVADNYTLTQIGGIALGSTYKLSYQFLAADKKNDSFTIAGTTNGTTWTNFVNAWDAGSGDKSGTLDISGYTGLKVILHSDGNNKASTLNFDVSPVPEPGEWAMILAGLGLVGTIARRRSLKG
jgi:hypothetical protein